MTCPLLIIFNKNNHLRLRKSDCLDEDGKISVFKDGNYISGDKLYLHIFPRRISTRKKIKTFYKKMNEKTKLTKVCWTLNNPWGVRVEELRDEQKKREFVQKVNELFDRFATKGGHAYSVCQLEVGENTHTPHLQGFSIFMQQIELGRQGRVSEDGKVLRPRGFLGCFPLGCGHPHVEKARGSNEQNKLYCTKAETRALGPWERGTLPAQHTDKEVDSATFVAQTFEAQGWESWEDVPLPMKIGRTGLMLHTVMQEHQQRQLATKCRDVRVAVLVGQSGWGKSTLAMKMCEEQGWMPQTRQIGSGRNLWFSNVEAKYDILFWDEFDAGQISLPDFNRLCDGQPCLLPSKGKSGYASFDKIIILSNHDPESWFKRTMTMIGDDGRRCIDDLAQEDYERKRTAMKRRLGLEKVDDAFGKKTGKTWILPDIKDMRMFARKDALGRTNFQLQRYLTRKAVTEWLGGDVSKMELDQGLRPEDVIEDASSPEDIEDVSAPQEEEEREELTMSRGDARDGWMQSVISAPDPADASVLTALDLPTTIAGDDIEHPQFDEDAFCGDLSFSRPTSPQSPFHF